MTKHTKKYGLQELINLTGKNMEKFRSDKNLSGKEISNMAGIKHSAYRSYEARTNCIPIKKLIRLSNAMEITIDSFISGEKMPNKKPYTEDDIKHMGKRIRELRKEKKQTPIRIAIELGLTDSAVTRFERENTITTQNAVRLAEYYNCTLDYLLFGRKCENCNYTFCINCHKQNT